MGRRGFATIVVLGLAFSACGSDKKSSSSATTEKAADTSTNTASAPGITKDEITVGVVTSETGVAASNNKGVAGLKARMDAENAAGGINGRKIKVVAEDDTSGPTPNLTATQKIVQQSSPFVMVNQSAFAFASYRYSVEQKVPTVTGGYDGPQYADEGNEYLLPLSGNLGKGFPTSTAAGLFFKSKGVTKAAGLGYGISPSSSRAAESFAKQGVVAAGLPVGYVNTAIPFGGENVGPIILDMKKQGVDGIYMAMDNNTNFAIASQAVQNDLIPKAMLAATGYDDSLLENANAVATAEKANMYISTSYVPVEADNNAATKKMVATLKKYGGFTGSHPSFGLFEAYAQAELIIEALKKAPKNPTRQDFVDAARTFDNYTGNGLTCSGVSLTMASYGKVDTTRESCAYVVKVVDGKFVVDSQMKGHLLQPPAS
jgi:branched-chain amino acid transport system substrate-binding protein